MGLLSAVLLRVLHFIYALIIIAQSFWKRHTSTTPLPLQAVRRRIPKHLAIILVTDPKCNQDATEDTLVHSVVRAVDWCRKIGVDKLTVYEEHGLLFNVSQDIRDRLPNAVIDSDSSESELEYPLTPPASDYSESRPLSPQQSQRSIIPTITFQVSSPSSRKGPRRKSSVKRRLRQSSHHTVNPLTICLISRESSKPAIAAAARSIVQEHHQGELRGADRDIYQLKVEELDQVLEGMSGEDGLSSPDFMIIHPLHPIEYNRTPSELHGFPPWHIRLTEIYHNKSRGLQRGLFRNVSKTLAPTPLNETCFREALDEFAAAEMRFGK